MDMESVRLQIEKDLEWRSKEIRSLEGQLNNFTSRAEDDAKRFRKALVLMLYAHFEGFFRYSFRLYVEELNNKSIRVSEAVEVLVVASLYKEFGSYDNGKSENTNSEDINGVQRRIKQRAELITSIYNLYETGIVKLPLGDDHRDKSSIINTESNLNADVIKKIFDRLGLSSDDIFKMKVDGRTLKSVLNEFLGRRNAVAHGDGSSRDGISSDEYREYQDVFKKVTEHIPIMICNALREEKYLKRRTSIDNA